MKEMNLGQVCGGTLLVFIDLSGLVASGTWALGVPVLVGVVVLFDSRVVGVWGADLKFQSLNFSVNVVVASVGGGWFVEKVKEYGDEDDSSGEGIKHRRV